MCAQCSAAGDWAHVAGLWHDLGKYSVEFQRRIKSISVTILKAQI
jgi:CRISPR-associated endonuclease/helicase Cas3